MDTFFHQTPRIKNSRNSYVLKIGIIFSIIIWLLVFFELIITHFAFYSESLILRNYAGFLAFFAGQIAMGVGPLLVAWPFLRFSHRMVHLYQIATIIFIQSFIGIFLFKVGWTVVLIWYFGKGAFSVPFLNVGVFAIWGIYFFATCLEVILLKRVDGRRVPPPEVAQR